MASPIPFRKNLGVLLGGSALLVAFQMTAGCNAVLGIEPATHDEDLDRSVSGLCKWPVARVKASCEDKADETCAAACKINECLADKGCREALMVYRRCVGSSCDDTKGQCGDCGSNDGKAKEVFQCLTNNRCFIAGATSLCESYCECMSQRCDANLPGGSLDGCKSVCAAGGLLPQGTNQYFVTAPEPWKTYCLWEHCEMGANPNDALHCAHARGTIDVCSKEPEDAPVGPVCDVRKGYGNAACNGPDDCCSRECQPSGLCTEP